MNLIEPRYVSPIHPTIEDTHSCFDAVVADIVSRPAVLEGRSLPNILVATHNQR